MNTPKQPKNHDQVVAQSERKHTPDKYSMNKKIDKILDSGGQQASQKPDIFSLLYKMYGIDPADPDAFQQLLARMKPDNESLKTPKVEEIIPFNPKIYPGKNFILNKTDLGTQIFPPLFASKNVVPYELKTFDFGRYLAELYREYGIDPSLPNAPERLGQAIVKTGKSGKA